MLKMKVASRRWLQDTTGTIFTSPETTLLLEHSLISISKWEAKWKIPFETTFTSGLEVEQFRDYVRCMTINKGVDNLVYFAITPKQFEEIQQYIGDPATATTIRDTRKKTSHKKKVVTSELVYYWMFSNNIPLGCEKWHFNRLMTLIQVCFLEGGGAGGKMSQREVLKQNALLNSMRKQRHHTKG